MKRHKAIIVFTLTLFILTSYSALYSQSFKELYDLSKKALANGEFEKSELILHQILGNKDSLTVMRKMAVYNRFGLINKRAGNYKNAMKFYKKAERICHQKYGKDHILLSLIYNNLGIVSKEEGFYDKAIDYYKRGIELNLKSNRWDKTKEIYELAKLYHNIGIVYKYKSNYLLSFQNLMKSLTIRKKYKIKGLEMVYANLARTYTKVGDFSRAKTYFLESIFEYTNKKVSENYKLGLIYIEYAELLTKTGKIDSIHYYLTKGLKIYTNYVSEKHPNRANVNRIISKIYDIIGDEDKAIEYIQKSLISNSLDFNNPDIFRNPKINVCLSKPQLFSSLKAKIKYLLKYSSELSNLRKIQYLAGSVLTSKLAYKLADIMQNEYSYENTKLLLSKEAKHFHQNSIKAALELNKYQPSTENNTTIFNFLEKSKSTTLAAHLYDSRIKNYLNLSDSLIEKERDIKAYRRYYQTNIQKEKAKGVKMDSAKVNNYQDMLFTYSKSYDTLINTLKEKHPEYYQLKYEQEVANLKSVQHHLGKNKTLISYFVGDTSLFIAALTNDSVVYKEIKTDSLFTTAIIDYHIDIKSDFNQEIKESSAYLYNYLIKPVEELINDKTELVIIPDGSLYYTPFETLCKSKTFSGNLTKVDYLIKKYRISYHHSATLWLNNQHQKKVIYKGKSFIGFAPVFDSKVNNGYILSSNWISDSTNIDLTTRSISSDLKHFNTLPHSEKEIKSILKLFRKKRANAEGFFHYKANEENFKNKVSDYKYIHIASHSFTNDKYPALSGIAFSQPDTTINNEDGILYASESYNLNLSNADLVVLSSCSSGLGKLIKGEGFLSLSRGFLYSGVPNIVFSLWNVKDEPTKDLMVYFYKHLLNGKTYAESLRSAKLKLLSKAETASPKYWAAWSLVGE